ncbi:amidohydrolase family protein [Roseomonas sp. OT10]|uniref:amidohydrolase family protein n=1 Tax=Roseomonas cutis TaxID=2897332 RepID=UPI001E5C2FA8|nr:amidohydrolase family protein [Roseomonas sp. OT10]UFN47658.1 amidohydrolase family protein [Roseomonas sp. OT10]
MTDLIIEGGTVITMDGARRVIPDGAVAVTDGKIAAVGPRAEVAAAHPEAAQRIDARGKAVLPGLIDGHAHAGHGLVKTLANGNSAAWMEACRVIYTLASPPSFWAAEGALAALERLRFGVTTGVSLLGGGDSVMRSDDPAFAAAHCDAVRGVGTRSIVAIGPTRPPFPRPYIGVDGVERPVTFEQQMEVVEEVIRAQHGKGGIRIATLTATHREEHGDDPAMTAEVARQSLATKELADRYGCLFHQDGHRSGSVVTARNFGLLGPNTFFSHCTDLTEGDIDAFAETGTGVVHNPSAIASVRGYCPAITLLERGVNVMLGSDATAPDRSGDMFRHMFQLIRYHQRKFQDEKLLPPGKALEMCTVDAARTLGLSDEIGSLEPGKLADVITVDLEAPHMAPANMPVSRVVYFASGGDVRDVVVGGRVLLRDGAFTEADRAAIVGAAEAETAAMLSRAGLEALAVEAPGWGRLRR